MSTYAANTQVNVAKSKAEIENTLQRYGCSGFMTGWSENKAMIAFQINERQVKFLLPLPNPSDDEFTKTDTGKVRKPEASHRVWEQGCRQRWRALALAIKAKLEAVECGIVSFDQEFLAHLVLPGGGTVGEEIIPMIERGEMPKLALTS